jgi:hypothetical protein
MKHSPLIRLHAAKRAYDTALSNCAHWDYEHDEEPRSNCDCCTALRCANTELANARMAYNHSLGV